MPHDPSQMVTLKIPRPLYERLLSTGAEYEYHRTGRFAFLREPGTGSVRSERSLRRAPLVHVKVFSW